ncbi:MAG TPA: indole-3-glycerol phosphate synthase TrpC [Syntrophales bacterium]|nr:indole-3-glycerol phosphate synthase TrpC [Syntrophales bacterium]HOM07578.1 indole-3-glycerol phosphate synthase TrpC [Syntrophales bacterium]HPQ07182.1 indole-3-glycerol phosphate synthase TrpC [Syntrophales bacterium]HRS87476.1 indole-3-glycerol phosphate synthase TrpC [Syntrophales bacterium]HRV43070.1 indole-3-glycerol phosphate synthase TrpC [Syntrophales bacterium]
MEAGGFLARIVALKREEVAAAKKGSPLGEAAGKARPALKRDLAAALRGRGVAVIAEIKAASPSRGRLTEDLDPAALARLYEAHGAAAVSVVTEGAYFGGSAALLAAARGATGLPVLRKDFVVDACQIRETAAMGADALLLIASILGRGQLAQYTALCREEGLTPLVEVHDEKDLEKALDAEAEVIGINNRDLVTFETDLAVTLRLAPLVPPGKVVVSESGIGGRRDIERLLEAGVSAFLVGEAILRAPDRGAKLKELIG